MRQRSLGLRSLGLRVQLPQQALAGVFQHVQHLLETGRAAVVGVGHFAGFMCAAKMRQQVQAIAGRVKSLRADAVHLNTTTRPAQAGVAVPRVPEAWMRTVSAWFSPVAEIPVFSGKAVSSAAMSDAALLDLLARHPISVAALAASAGTEEAAIERRLAPLVAAGRLAIELHDGLRMARAVTA